MKILSINCTESIYNHFYRIIDKVKTRDKTVPEILEEMMKAYEKEIASKK